MEGGDDSMVRLSCSHSFHQQCLQAQVAAGTDAAKPRLTFGFLRCALYRTPMQDDAIDGLAPHLKLQSKVIDVCWHVL